MPANNQPLTFTWLQANGFHQYGVEWRHPNLPHFAFVLQEKSEELGQLVDKYFYEIVGQPSAKAHVYSAYYLNVGDFLSENVIK